jgi:hypothetical protein
VGGESIFKPTIENVNLHQDSNDIGIRIVNFAASKNQKHDVPAPKHS